MRKKIIIAGLMAAITTVEVNQVFAVSNMETALLHEHSKTVTFKVYGNCGMCQKRIDDSVNEMKGVKSASWNVDTKIIEVTYNDRKVTLEEIKKEIAKVGYDTEEYKATDKAYDGLPGCCQYERDTKK